VHLFELNQLVDMELIKWIPTRTNAISGDESISKILNKFMMSNHLLGGDTLVKEWVGSGGQLDHLLILLKLEKDEHKLPSPFKFNCSWLLEEDFKKLVVASWT
jgi:hypothetical protein